MVWGIGICLRAEKGVEGACKEGKGDVVLDYDDYIQDDRVRQYKLFLSANYLGLTRANWYFGIRIPGSETLLYFIACNAMKYYPLSKNEILFWRRAAVTYN